MELSDITNQLTGLVDGSTFDMPVLTLAAAALAFGFVMATVPKALKVPAMAYGVAMAFVISQHQMQYLYYGIAGGFAAALVFRTFSRKRANA